MAKKKDNQLVVIVIIIASLIVFYYLSNFLAIFRNTNDIVCVIEEEGVLDCVAQGTNIIGDEHFFGSNITFTIQDPAEIWGRDFDISVKPLILNANPILNEFFDTNSLCRTIGKTVRIYNADDIASACKNAGYNNHDICPIAQSGSIALKWINDPILQAQHLAVSGCSNFANKYGDGFWVYKINLANLFEGNFDNQLITVNGTITEFETGKIKNYSMQGLCDLSSGNCLVQEPYVAGFREDTIKQASIDSIKIQLEYGGHEPSIPKPNSSLLPIIIVLGIIGLVIYINRRKK